MPSPGTDGSFIGRADELGRMERRLAETVAGRGALVVISGESGIGKTRLVTEFVHRARHHGAQVLVGGSFDFGDNGPSFGPVLDALRPAWRHVGVKEPSSSTSLSTPQPSTSSASSGPPPAGPSAPSGSDVAQAPTWTGPVAGVADQPPAGVIPMCELALRTLRRLAGEAAVVLVVEDVHWADRSTLGLLAFLVAHLHEDPVMVVVTYRKEEAKRHSLTDLLMAFRRSGRADFVDLRPFTRHEMVAQLQGLLGRPPGDDLVELTWARSGGNALYAEELVATLDQGQGSELPVSWRDVLRCRLEVLPVSVRRVVRLVAVARDGVSLPLLAEVAELSSGDLTGAVSEAVEHLLLAVTTDGPTYQLRHSLMQEVFYDDLPPGERQFFHAAYARALSRSGDRPDRAAAARLAYHWYAAGDAERALVAAVAAAAAAAGVFGFAEAQSLYERAVGLWDHVANAPGVVGMARSDLLERAAEVAYLAGDPHQATALMAAALAEAEVPAGDGSGPGGDTAAPAAPTAHAAPASGMAVSHDAGVRRATRRQLLGRYLWAAGESREALRAYQEAVRCLPVGQASPERAGIEGAFAEALMLSGRYRLSYQQAEAALQIARASGARLEETRILATLGFDLVFLGDSASGLAAMERAQAFADELGDPDGIAQAYLHRAQFLAAPLGSLAEAAEAAERGVARVRQLGLERTYVGTLQAIEVTALFLLGRWSEAEDLLGQAWAAEPAGSAAIDLLLARASLTLGRGEFEAAEAVLAAVETLAVGGVGARYEAPLLLLRAGLDLGRGRPREARDAVSRGIVATVTGCADVWLLAPFIWHGLRAEADLAEAARAQRDPALLAAATALAAGLWAQFQSLDADAGNVAPSIRRSIEAYHSLCQGEVARADGGPEPEAWAEAARRWQELRQPYHAAYADWRHAEALLAQRSRSSRAAELLKAAHQSALRLGAEPIRRQVEGLARSARLVLDVPAAGPQRHMEACVVAQDAARERYGLSSRELEVWLQLPEGLTNNQIGQRLFISGKTASVHVTNILRKLGVRSRVQAITLAHQLGLVAVEAEPEAEPDIGADIGATVEAEAPPE